MTEIPTLKSNSRLIIADPIFFYAFKRGPEKNACGSRARTPVLREQLHS